MRIKRLRFSTIVIIVGACLSILIYCLLFTTRGSSFVVTQAVGRFTAGQNLDIGKTTGNLSSSLIMHDIELKSLAGLPPGTTVKIQRLETTLLSFGLAGLNIKVDNGRLRLPGSKPILFYGSYSNFSLDIDLYCQQLHTQEFLDFFSEHKALKSVSGRISDLDMNIKGSLSEPALRGTFAIQELSRNGFSMANCPVSFETTLKDLKGELKVFGDLNFNSGIMSGLRSATIKLQKSKVSFSGNSKNPSLALKATAAIEGTKVFLALSGSVEKPDLQLKSEPPLSQQRLLLMLVTGKSWKGAELALDQGRISLELAQDFVDYFFFGSSGSKIAKRFGIDDIALKYSGQTKGVEIKKNISDKLEATYGVEQSEQNNSADTSTHKVGAGYKITDTVSAGVEKELSQDNADSQGKLQSKDKAVLKYKKDF
ncbi:translocation/assembly module TamB domain-containing protein [Candidatus Omnitrophota bacterium]